MNRTTQSTSIHKNRKYIHRISLLAMAILCSMLLCTSSCYKEKFTTDGGDMLTYSLDTLMFDTVFTEISTVTRYFKVFNPNKLSVRIDQVTLTGPNAEFFTLNVDGYTGDIIRDVEIRPNDSIYVFAEATIDPDQPLSVSPFILEADAEFQYNGNLQKTKLIAWGQNANYIPGPDASNRISLLTCDLGDEVWDDPKPYVLYGTLLIDSCTLILPPGTRLYVHGGIANNQLGIYNEGLIYTFPDGRIEVRGTVDEPVLIRDDRIEPDHSGEWAGIRLGPESGPHLFSHMRLSHARTGIATDSATIVNMDHSSIAYTNGPGFFARHATATLSNCLFYENGSQAVALTYGGDYEVAYTTMASYGNDREALLLNNFYCSDPLCQEGLFLNKMNARVFNSLMVGSSRDEVWMVDAASPEEGLLDVQMFNSVVVVDELLDAENFPDFFETICMECLTYRFGDTLFVDINMDDYHLDSLSLAEEKAIPLIQYSDDFDGQLRDMLLPDIGCYEYQY